MISKSMSKAYFRFVFFLLSLLFWEETSFAVTPQSEYPYFLSVCAIFKDEAPFLKEWIEYNKLIGVQHFRLYNNDSEDNYLEVLSPYIKSGEVVLTDWPGHVNWSKEIQATAILDAICHLQGVSKWLAIIDIDEFILPTEHPDLVSFLNEYDSFGGVVINWQNYGTGWIQDLPKDKLMIETLRLKAIEDSWWNHPGKSIVKPDYVDTSRLAWHPHTWHYLAPYIAVAPNKKEYVVGPIDISKIRINHYVHRSENYFYNVKIPKKTRMEGWPDYAEDWHQACNKVVDKENYIYRFIPELRKKIFSDSSAKQY